MTNDLLFPETTSKEDYVHLNHLNQQDEHEEASGEHEDTASSEYEDTQFFHEADSEDPLVMEKTSETTPEPHNIIKAKNRESEQEQLYLQITRELRAIKVAIGRINEGVDCDTLPLTLRSGIQLEDVRKPTPSKMTKKEPTPIYARVWFVTMISFVCSCFFTTLSSLALMLYLQKLVTNEVRQGLVRALNDDEANDETNDAQEMKVLQAPDDDVQKTENAEQAI